MFYVADKEGVIFQQWYSEISVCVQAGRILK